MADLLPPPPPPSTIRNESSCREQLHPLDHYHDYTTVSYIPCDASHAPPCFEDEMNSFAAKTMRGSYGKVVSMDYLVRKIAQFFVSGSLQALDVVSDIYYVSQLYTSPTYSSISDSLKSWALSLLAFSLVLWSLVSLSIANSFKVCYLRSDVS